MNPLPHRRSFLAQRVIPAVGLLTAGPSALAQQDKAPPTPEKAKAKARVKTPQLEADLVRDFVRVAHKDLDKVREMLDKTPGLLNACWDWGGGDWETALGAAAHTGGKVIALLLLERGARLDIFAAAMLGRIEVVRAAVTAFPGTVKARGPHGIPLIDHARMGKDDAAEVLKFLEPLVANS
jgi:hypothetical protein